MARRAKVLQLWEDHPEPSMPKHEITLRITALSTLSRSGRLQHPMVQWAAKRPLCVLHKRARKRRKKHNNSGNQRHRTKKILQTHAKMAGMLFAQTGRKQRIPSLKEWVRTECILVMHATVVRKLYIQKNKQTKAKL